MSRPSPAWYAAMASLVGVLIVPPLAAEEQGTVAAVGGVVRRRRRCHGCAATPAWPSRDDQRRAAWRRQDCRCCGRANNQSRVEADEQGKFVCALPRGGVYQLVAGDQLTSIRAWTAQAAPPGCAEQLIVVSGDVLRGQGGRIPYTQVNPWLVAGVVAVAVAIPVVLSNHRSDRGDGS